MDETTNKNGVMPVSQGHIQPSWKIAQDLESAMQVLPANKYPKEWMDEVFYNNLPDGKHELSDGIEASYFTNVVLTSGGSHTWQIYLSRLWKKLTPQAFEKIKNTEKLYAKSDFIEVFWLQNMKDKKFDTIKKTGENNGILYEVEIAWFNNAKKILTDEEKEERRKNRTFSENDQRLTNDIGGEDHPEQKYKSLSKLNFKPLLVTSDATVGACGKYIVYTDMYGIYHVLFDNMVGEHKYIGLRHDIDFNSISWGGWLSIDWNNKIIERYGESWFFGEDAHGQTVAILKEAFPDYQIQDLHAEQDYSARIKEQGKRVGNIYLYQLINQWRLIRTDVFDITWKKRLGSAKWYLKQWDDIKKFLVWQDESFMVVDTETWKISLDRYPEEMKQEEISSLIQEKYGLETVFWLQWLQ